MDMVLGAHAKERAGLEFKSRGRLLMCRLAPTQGHLVRIYGLVVDKPLRGGN
ncbi:hypothetical protein ACLOJK_021003 [Asimina triloba]